MIVLLIGFDDHFYICIMALTGIQDNSYWYIRRFQTLTLPGRASAWCDFLPRLCGDFYTQRPGRQFHTFSSGTIIACIQKK